MNFIKHIAHNLYNIPGWQTNRHLVVIESDDWGAIRMPSKEVYNQFLKEGIRVDNDPYCRYDSLATKEDLEVLFEALQSVKDKNGRSAVLTADTVVANPDFEKIRKSGFREYFYEPITTTMNNSPNHTNVFDIWKEGIDAGIFRPQFHGREHLNVKKWLHVLREGKDPITRRAFELGTFGLTSKVSDEIKGTYMGAFDSALEGDIQEYTKIIKEGLDLFEKLFGYRSRSFIATTYTWHPLIENSLKENGIDFLQGLVTQHIPVDDGHNYFYKRTNFQGKSSASQLIYLMRNCFFEPSQFNNYHNAVDECLSRIRTAFRWKKAAVICSHRLNFIGNIDSSNRDRNIHLFTKLLNEIVKRWPDVEFVSSDELGSIIMNTRLGFRFNINTTTYPFK